MTAKLALLGSASFADAPGHLSGEFPVLEEQLDQRGDYFLSGHSGVSEPVGSVALPNVEGSVGGGRQIDGAAGALAPRWRLGLLVVRVVPEALKAFGLR
jgi:hypothetical protein